MNWINKRCHSIDKHQYDDSVSNHLHIIEAPTTISAGDSIFAEDVVTRLPYRRIESSTTYPIASAMIEEECIVGLEPSETVCLSSNIYYTYSHLINFLAGCSGHYFYAVHMRPLRNPGDILYDEVMFICMYVISYLLDVSCSMIAWFSLADVALNIYSPRCFLLSPYSRHGPPLCWLCHNIFPTSLFHLILPTETQRSRLLNKIPIDAEGMAINRNSVYIGSSGAIS